LLNGITESLKLFDQQTKDDYNSVSKLGYNYRAHTRSGMNTHGRKFTDA